MVMIAKVYLYLVSLLFLAIGVTAVFSPATIAANFDLLMQSGKGMAEIRCIYGGGFLAWSAIILGGLHSKTLSAGLLVSMMTSMGCIAVVRVLSLILDGAYDLNIPGVIAEALIVASCWVLYKGAGPKSEL